MSQSLYDQAIVKKLRFWTQDSTVSIADPEDVFRYKADAEGEDKIVLPFVSVNRGPIRLIRSGKLPTSREGFKLQANGKKITHLRMIPVQLRYQLDIYARKRAQCDDLIREIVFKLVNNPRLEIEIPYEDSKYTHKFTLTLEDDIEDNSDVAHHLEKGEYYRMTLNIVIEDAYLFDYRAKDTVSLDLAVNDERVK